MIKYCHHSRGSDRHVAFQSPFSGLSLGGGSTWVRVEGDDFESDCGVGQKTQALDRANTEKSTAWRGEPERRGPRGARQRERERRGERVHAQEPAGDASCVRGLQLQLRIRFFLGGPAGTGPGECGHLQVYKRMRAEGLTPRGRAISTFEAGGW